MEGWLSDDDFTSLFDWADSHQQYVSLLDPSVDQEVTEPHLSENNIFSDDTIKTVVESHGFGNNTSHFQQLAQQRDWGGFLDAASQKVCPRRDWFIFLRESPPSEYWSHAADLNGFMLAALAIAGEPDTEHIVLWLHNRGKLDCEAVQRRAAGTGATSVLAKVLDLGYAKCPTVPMLALRRNHTDTFVWSQLVGFDPPAQEDTAFWLRRENRRHK